MSFAKKKISLHEATKNDPPISQYDEILAFVSIWWMSHYDNGYISEEKIHQFLWLKIKKSIDHEPISIFFADSS